MDMDESTDQLDRTYRVLSIQSHVVHGYVGNKVATLALQMHGIDVDPINTVQLSNNTAYSSWEGKALSDKEIYNLYEGLCKNNLNNYTHILTGYMRNVTNLKCVYNIIKDLKEKNKDLIYVCDPVMGDHGQLYRSMDENIISFYKEKIIPLATTVKLNQTEIEFLTGTKIKDDNDALKAIDMIHELNVKNVIISSTDYSNDEDMIGIIGSTKMDDDKYIRFKMSVPRLKVKFTGTGDLFSSLILAYGIKYEMDTALQLTVSSIQHVLQNSIKNRPPDSYDENTFIELELVKSRYDLISPKKVYDIDYDVRLK